MTEEYPHLTFLSENHIDTETLPRLLQKRIRGFEELYEDLPHTLAEDRPDLVNRLNTLSLEIEEDLEEHYADRLESDPDEIEELLTEDTTVITEPAETSFTVPAEQEQPSPQTLEPEAPSEPASEKIATDSEIVWSLWKEGYRQLLPGVAAAKGLKTPLRARKIIIGNFCLQRRKYSSFYDISLAGE